MQIRTHTHTRSFIEWFRHIYLYNITYRLLTVEIGLVRIVHQHAIVLGVPDPVAVDVRIAFVAFAVAVRVQLIGIGRFRTIVHAVLDAVSVGRRVKKAIFFFIIIIEYFTN